jgi:hypothetical protein
MLQNRYRYSPVVCAASALLFVLLASSPSPAATVIVPAGGKLQDAINNATPGDTIVLQAGAVYGGPITLRNKPGYESSTEWITIRTSTPDGSFPLPGTRVTPAHQPLMATIVSPGSNLAALDTEPRAHHYRLIGIEFRPVDASAYVREIVRLGDGTTAQNSLAAIPHHLEIQRCYVHAFPTQDTIRGIALNSASTTIVDSYIAQIHSAGFDSQAVWGWNGPGPYDIINNYLEGAGENVGFGGADPVIYGLIPSNIRILRNHIAKPFEWRGKWLEKNLIELKSGQDVLIEGNLMENTWAHAQPGWAFVLSVRNQNGTAPWSTIRNVTIRNNIIRNVANGIAIMGIDDQPWPSVVSDNFLITNNLFYNVNGPAYGGSAFFLTIAGGAKRVVVTHNTFDGIPDGGSILMVGGAPAEGFVLRDNIFSYFYYRFVAVPRPDGTSIPLSYYLPGGVVSNNVITGGDSYDPPGNFYPSVQQFRSLFRSAVSGDYALVAGSTYARRATDGKDVGVDMSLLTSAPTIAPRPEAPTNVRIVP